MIPGRNFSPVAEQRAVCFAAPTACRLRCAGSLLPGTDGFLLCPLRSGVGPQMIGRAPLSRSGRRGHTPTKPHRRLAACRPSTHRTPRLRAGGRRLDRCFGPDRTIVSKCTREAERWSIRGAELIVIVVLENPSCILHETCRVPTDANALGD